MTFADPDVVPVVRDTDTFPVGVPRGSGLPSLIGTGVLVL